MADNYLEKKMEELRSGRNAVSRSGRGSMVAGSNQPRKGYLSFRLDARRILVQVPEMSAASICSGYVRAGCSVAYAGYDSEFGKGLAYREGIRFYDMNSGSFPDFTSVISDITRVWHDLDLAILYISSEADLEMAQEIATAWSDFRNTGPHISDYKGRMILLTDNPAAVQSLHILNDTLATAGIATISLRVSPEYATHPDTFARQIQWLSLSQASILPDIIC